MWTRGPKQNRTTYNREKDSIMRPRHISRPRLLIHQVSHSLLFMFFHPHPAFSLFEDLELALEAKKLQIQYGNNIECPFKWEKRGKAAYTDQHIDEVGNE